MSTFGDAVTWLKVPLGRVELRLHWAVPLVPAVLAVLGGGLWARYLSVLGVLLLHEAGHAAASVALGGRAAVIRLWPLFGRADVEPFPDRRLAAVALAGPAANLLLAAGLWAAGARLDGQLARAAFPDLLLTVSLAMGVANLLPVPPLDGGRALSSLRRG